MGFRISSAAVYIRLRLIQERLNCLHRIRLGMGLGEQRGPAIQLIRTHIGPLDQHCPESQLIYCITQKSQRQRCIGTGFFLGHLRRKMILRTVSSCPCACMCCTRSRRPVSGCLPVPGSALRKTCLEHGEEAFSDICFLLRIIICEFAHFIPLISCST